MNIKIAVCDDCQQQAQDIKMLVNKWAKESGVQIQADMFGSAENFKAEWNKDKTYDIVLLDIQMDGQSGVELAREIRQSDDKLVIVFITGFADYISEGYDVSALHYLMKPVSEDKLFEVLDKAKKNLAQKNKTLVFALKGETHQIPLYKIYYLEVLGNYTTIHSELKYTVKKTLGEFEKQLDDNFFRVGKSHIVNLKYIRKSTRKEIYLQNGEVIPLARGLYEALNRAMINKL
jgi:DNA-binding LytR/AlgR family response regulator